MTVHQFTYLWKNPEYLFSSWPNKTKISLEKCVPKFQILCIIGIVEVIISLGFPPISMQWLRSSTILIPSTVEFDAFTIVVIL